MAITNDRLAEVSSRPINRGRVKRDRLVAGVLVVLTLVGLLVALSGKASAQSATAYPCAPSIAPSPQQGQAELQRSYDAWKSRYLTSAGAGGYLRVQRTENGNDTVSEGIAYGMLIAAYRRDRATLDGLWGYARSHRDANGLMHWRIDANNNVTGYNAATDADQDMALALIVADKTWGGYRNDAVDLINRVMQYMVEPNSFVLKPGDVWGGSSVTNPSYFAPAFYKVFGSYTGDSRWTQVVDASYRVIANVNARTGAGNTGLQPDWATASGEPAQGMGYNYSYDATRVPWRLAADAAWHCDQRASAQLTKLNGFFKGIGAANIRDGYRLDGATIGQWHNAAFVGPAASAAITSGDAGYQRAMWDETVRLANENYYNDHLRLLALLLMSGTMTNPLATSVPATATSIPATATSIPATATSIPATATSISATATGLPATATSLPATATGLPATATSAAATTTTMPATSTPAIAAACTVRYGLTNDWGMGMVADVTITNNTGATTDGWRVGWTFGGNQRIINLWNGVLTQQGQAVSVRDASWNRAIANGAKLNFGFQAEYRGQNLPPTNFTLNGTPCTMQ